jgi:putative sterol carrier protein
MILIGATVGSFITAIAFKQSTKKKFAHANIVVDETKTTNTESIGLPKDPRFIMWSTDLHLIDCYTGKISKMEAMAKIFNMDIPSNEKLFRLWYAATKIEASDITPTKMIAYRQEFGNLLQNPEAAKEELKKNLKAFMKGELKPYKSASELKDELLQEMKNMEGVKSGTARIDITGKSPDEIREMISNTISDIMKNVERAIDEEEGREKKEDNSEFSNGFESND